MRKRNQITIPAEVKEALKVRVGDFLKFVINADGTVTVSGINIPRDDEGNRT